MSTKLLKALPCLFALALGSAYGQFFVDFCIYGSAAYRFLPSETALHLPSAGIGLGARLRSFFAPSIDVVLTGLGRKQYDEYFMWVELHYRLLLQLQYQQTPTTAPSVSLEWIFPILPSVQSPWRQELRRDLRVVRVGGFAGLSIPNVLGGRYLHLLAGTHYSLRRPQMLSSRLIPEVRLLWESR
ncbi:MAG: hypothetical protein ABDH31_01460 [Chlorobiota bacterium]